MRVLLGSPGVCFVSSKDLGGQQPAGKSKAKAASKAKAKPKATAVKGKAKSKPKAKAKSKNGGKQPKAKAVVKKKALPKKPVNEKDMSDEEAEEETMESDEEVDPPVIMKRPAAKRQTKKGDPPVPDTPAVEPPRQKKPPIEPPVFTLAEKEEIQSTGPSPVENQAEVPDSAPVAAAVPPLKRARTEGDETQWPPEAELRAVKEKQASQQELGYADDVDRDKLYRRMDAELWDQCLLAQDCRSSISQPPKPHDDPTDTLEDTQVVTPPKGPETGEPDKPPQQKVHVFHEPLKKETVVVGATLTPPVSGTKQPAASPMHEQPAPAVLKQPVETPQQPAAAPAATPVVPKQPAATPAEQPAPVVPKQPAATPAEQPAPVVPKQPAGTPAAAAPTATTPVVPPLVATPATPAVPAQASVEAVMASAHALAATPATAACTEASSVEALMASVGSQSEGQMPAIPDDLAAMILATPPAAPEQDQQQQTAPGQRPLDPKINTSTNRAASMRLNRFMESSEGQKFPHMLKLFNSNSDEPYSQSVFSFALHQKHKNCFVSLVPNSEE
eukprot:s696_g9.t1